MVVKGKYEYKYLALNLKASVVKRFRSFAKKIAGSQSDALEKMLPIVDSLALMSSRHWLSNQISQVLFSKSTLINKGARANTIIVGE